MVRGGVLKQSSEQIVHRFFSDGVIIIQNQNEGLVNLVQFVYQDSGQYLFRR